MTSEKTVRATPQPDAEYGLDDAAAKIVRFGVGDAEHELRIGETTPIGSNVYARTGDSPAVHMIASHRATAFARSLTDLRDKQILAFDPSAIARGRGALAGRPRRGRARAGAGRAGEAGRRRRRHRPTRAAIGG